MKPGDQVTVKGKIVEIVDNEDFGLKYTIKIVCNGKNVTMTFDDSEIIDNSTGD